jgi:hypothetical protein
MLFRELSMADEKSKEVQAAIAELMKKVEGINPDFELIVKGSPKAGAASVKAGEFGNWHDISHGGGGFTDSFFKY